MRYQEAMLKVHFRGEEDKQKAMKAVCGLQGVDSISTEMRDQRLTVTGFIDSTELVNKLRKLFDTEMLTVGEKNEDEGGGGLRLQDCQKVILKVDLPGEKRKQKAMKAICGLQGVDSISISMKDQKMTVIGDFDPVDLCNKLRKLLDTDILYFGPAREPEKLEGNLNACAIL